MRLMSHPIRFDSEGAIVTIDEGSDRQAAELAGVIVATIAGERPLAPEYGITDPTATGVSAAAVSAAVSRCEPDLDVTAAAIEPSSLPAAIVRLSVTWAE